MSDHNLVSQEVHEMNHILERYGFRETEENRISLINKLSKFKNRPAYTPENRHYFYKYLESNYENYRKNAP